MKIQDDWIGIEIPWRYDWIAYFEDKDGNRYSRKWNPIEKDEACRYDRIYKVEFYDERWIKYKILWWREDVWDRCL